MPSVACPIICPVALAWPDTLEIRQARAVKFLSCPHHPNGMRTPVDPRPVVPTASAARSTAMPCAPAFRVTSAQRPAVGPSASLARIAPKISTVRIRSAWTRVPALVASRHAARSLTTIPHAPVPQVLPEIPSTGALRYCWSPHPPISPVIPASPHRADPTRNASMSVVRLHAPVCPIT